ncbi:nck-associated protein 5-like isoform X1 [Clupea harengus]|uniref:Nck-associated protein 5-like isoform X1 n=2 Tax=Clupea harengus TaxID=7950 RepID=A0A6P8FEF3_CLUHA|nr:nck-associated protein 5-like isoform X1 [Clupea harengus]
MHTAQTGGTIGCPQRPLSFMHRGEPASKVVMSEEAELRECNEAFESEEGDVDPFLEDEEGEEEEETESSREMMERLRELEAENSALALANESQREAYERCLDEVANHVVQALLNQKDLREECIKLKMRVFDLERQNRTLTELFTQKLHTHPNPLQQLPSVTLLEHNLEATVTSTEKMVASHCQGEAKNNGDRTQNGTPSQARGPATSMDALSPFFKKKAHILEVLRKLEESDPLKFHPSSCLSSYHDMGQTVFLGDFPGTSVSRAPHCRHSSSDSDIHEYASGEGALDDRSRGHGGCPSCRLLTQKTSLDSLLRGTPGHGGSFAAATAVGLPVREESVSGQIWVESHQQGASAGAPDPHVIIPSLESTSHPYTQSTRTDGRVVGGSVSEATDQSQEPGDEVRSLQHHKDKAAEKLSLRKSLSRSSDTTLQAEDGKHIEAPLSQSQDQSQLSSSAEQECCYLVVDTDATVKDEECEDAEKVCNGVYFSSNETSVSKKVAVDSYSPAPVPERNSSTPPQPQQLSSGKSKFALSPTSPPSCLSEVKPSPISSPSRLLKFLKIPAIGERPQTAQALRLSPQLTRSSKIPCRNNNYEVYHSPVMSRKATTTEREKISSSSSSPKTDTYPGTHSAPTSPPKPDEILCSPVPVNEVSYSSHSAPKPNRTSKGAPPSLSQSQRNSQKVPHYENVSDLAASNGLPQFIPFSQREGSTTEKQKRNTCDDKLLSPPSKNSDSSPATGTSPSDSSDEEETDTESPVWHKPHQHFSLPSSSSSASSKAQRVSTYSSMKDRPQERIASEAVQPQTVEAVQSAHTTGSRRGDQPPSLPKRTVSVKPQNETSHHPFKERLAALGKLKSNEDLHQPMDKKEAPCIVGRAPASSAPGNNERSKTAERQGDRNVVEHRHSKYTDSLDGKPYPKTSLAGYTKYPSTCHEVSPKSAVATGPASKGELETFSPRVYVAKSEGPKIKMGMSSSTEPHVVMRSYGKCQVPSNHHSKTSPSPQSSPTKVLSKSPSKAGQASSYPRGMKPVHDDRGQAQKHPARPEDKSKLTASKKKFVHAESFPPPPPPRPPVETSASTQSLEEKKPLAPPSGPQSAIEQKVMRGIEENMLKLQEQDRTQIVETKQKTSNGIASWFGLKKSKLPALSRKPEMSKLRLNMSSSSSSVSSAANKDSKAGPRKVVESLNISKLMEKAEDLRKALEEERAYVNGVGVGMPLDRTGRGHSCEVVMDPAQGQLSLMYRGVTADNFMQQLLNRVDDKGAPTFGMAHRRLSFDSKRSQPSFLHQRNGMSHTKSRDEMDKGPDMVGRDEVISDENLAESMSSQHFTGSGASMRTLDSGIGTFPLPDYASSAAGKSIPKTKPHMEQGFSASHGKHGPLMKVPRKARTLERELSSLEEVNPSALYGRGLEGKGPSMHLSSTIHEDIDAYGAHMQNPPTKNWTFPNLKGSAGSTDVYLGVQGDLEPSAQGTPSRRKQGEPQGPREVDPSSLPLAPQMGLSRRGKSRIPGGPEVGKEGGLELVKERPDDILSPSRPQALETPESLSDSLYDSLSSCGSQG